MRTNFFLFDSERASSIMFNLRPPIKMVDFHGEVTFISVFNGIRDIFEAQFIIQLSFEQFKYTYITVQILHLLFRCNN
jgi:hypothetical protein